MLTVKRGPGHISASRARLRYKGVMAQDNPAATPEVTSWEEATATLARHLHELVGDGGCETVVVSGDDRPPPPDAPRRGLFGRKPPLPIAVYVQFAALDQGFSGESVGVAGPPLSPAQERELLDLGWRAPGTNGVLQENYDRDFTDGEVELAAAMGIAALKILGATPQELRFESW